MTEQQLRQKVADKMTSWVGATKGSAKHAEILKIYNDHRPLARRYKMKVNDAYCAATVSAAWIACGLAPYAGTECGVEKFARLAQDKGIWVENDAHVPKLGDAVVYDWQDNGVGDCTGAGDHIGIVTKAGAMPASTIGMIMAWAIASALGTTSALSPPSAGTPSP